MKYILVAEYLICVDSPEGLLVASVALDYRGIQSARVWSASVDLSRGWGAADHCWTADSVVCEGAVKTGCLVCAVPEDEGEDEEETRECIYCGAELDANHDRDRERGASWSELAEHHRPWCDWIETQAHTR